jgi:hypothetical protein
MAKAITLTITSQKIDCSELSVKTRYGARRMMQTDQAGIQNIRGCISCVFRRRLSQA